MNHTGFVWTYPAFWVRGLRAHSATTWMGIKDEKSSPKMFHDGGHITDVEYWEWTWTRRNVTVARPTRPTRTRHQANTGTQRGTLKTTFEWIYIALIERCCAALYSKYRLKGAWMISWLHTSQFLEQFVQPFLLVAQPWCCLAARRQNWSPARKKIMIAF